MDERGWLIERTVQAVDSAGARLSVTVGITKNEAGKLRLALAIGNVRDAERSGPTALLVATGGLRLIAEVSHMLSSLMQRWAANDG